jgi:hypothetical protein
VSGLAKLGALFLLLMGIFWTLVGGLAMIGGGVFRTMFRDAGFEGLEQGQLADILGGAIFAVGLVILVVAIVEVAVGIFAWRGSGVARLMGILYGLVFGITSLMAASGARNAADTGRSDLVLFAFAAIYLYTAVVFIIRYRSAA